MNNLIICGEMHYRQNYLDQILLAELNLKTPNELKVVMLDPSLDSLCEFEGLPHLLFPICDGAHIRDALSRLCDMIKERKRSDVDWSIILVVAEWLEQNGFPKKLADEMDRIIKPTDWGVMKTEAIDMGQDFIWFDDSIFETERRALEANHALDRFYRMNSKDSKSAKMALKYLKSISRA